MRNFTKKVIEQIGDIYNYNFNNANKELIMALFMQFFLYKFDDKIESLIKFKNIQSITDATWKPSGNNSNELVGIPIFMDDDEKNIFYSCNLNSKTEYILNEIRNSIVHGDFFINDEIITIIKTIKDDVTGKRKEVFRMNFEFECIVDICSIIMNELGINCENEKHLYEFLLFVKDMSKRDYDYNKKRIDHYFFDLKYPIILFNLLPMNEDDFHNDSEYANFIIKLFSDKEFYKNGRLKNNTILRSNELYKLRNCIAHGQYYVNNDELVLFDHKENFVFNCLRLDELFELKEKNILRTIK